MKIVDHEPHPCFFAEENGSLILDVNCNHNFAGYSFMIELFANESAEYKNNDRSYLNWLARDIQDSAPIVATSNFLYKERDVSVILSEKLQLATESWNKTNG